MEDFYLREVRWGGHYPHFSKTLTVGAGSTAHSIIVVYACEKAVIENFGWGASI
jgi:hypothetical protein